MITDVFRVAFNWTNSDVPALTSTNVMHFKASGKVASDVASDITAHVTANMWKFQTNHSKVHDLVITKLDGSAVSFPYNTDLTSKWTGTLTDALFIPQASNLIKLLTAKRGRSYRGRVYLPWCSEQYGTDGVLNSTNVATCSAAWAAFDAAMDSAGTKLVVASYLHSTAEEVVALGCENYLATQRRRNKRNSTVG